MENGVERFYKSFGFMDEDSEEIIKELNLENSSEIGLKYLL